VRQLHLARVSIGRIRESRYCSLGAKKWIRWNTSRTENDELGYDQLGYDQLGYDELGYDELGYDELGNTVAYEFSDIIGPRK